ncbi:diguanylate cyclase (plasmid) [Klebsiella pneumoniae]|nr:diguanylate cyclase [Klebsiella pneumoniae]
MVTWKDKRQRNITEHITCTHIVCILLALLVLPALYNFTPWEAYRNFFYFSVVLSATIALIITLYLIKKLTLKSEPYLPYVGELFIICILLPLTLSLAVAFPATKFLLLIPVIIAATTWGKKVGVAVAAFSSCVVLISDLFPILHPFSPRAFQIDLVNAGVIVLTGWFIGGLTDIETETRNSLIHLANTDGLTGLYNHRYFQEELRRRLTEAEKTGRPLSLIMMDIDYFKFYNDAFGHQKGDQVLATIGRILARLVKEPSFAARYGGEEFVVVMPGATREAARELDEQIKREVAGFPFEGAENLPAGRMTISSGIACYPGDGTTARELIRVADDALYRAKYGRKTHLYFSVVDELRAFSHSEKELFNSLKTLLTIINARDRYTFGHSERVAGYAVALAERMGLPPDHVSLLQCGAYLHDIGKVEIPPEILNKPDKLDPKEWEIVKNHPEWGGNIVQPLTLLSAIVPLIRHHHENYDGSGYPDGLAGEEIPLFARILRIVDSFDAMTTDRPYKEAKTPVEACMVLKEEAGKMFDPHLVELFTKFILEQEERKNSISPQSRRKPAAG